MAGSLAVRWGSLRGTEGRGSGSPGLRAVRDHVGPVPQGLSRARNRPVTLSPEPQPSRPAPPETQSACPPLRQGAVTRRALCEGKHDLGTARPLNHQRVKDVCSRMSMRTVPLGSSWRPQLDMVSKPSGKGMIYSANQKDRADSPNQWDRSLHNVPLS